MAFSNLAAASGCAVALNDSRDLASPAVSPFGGLLEPCRSLPLPRKRKLDAFPAAEAMENSRQLPSCG
jgi:hypothetical protein